VTQHSEETARNSWEFLISLELGVAKVSTTNANMLGIKGTLHEVSYKVNQSLSQLSYLVTDYGAAQPLQSLSVYKKYVTGAGAALGDATPVVIPFIPLSNPEKQNAHDILLSNLFLAPAQDQQIVYVIESFKLWHDYKDDRFTSRSREIIKMASELGWDDLIACSFTKLKRSLLSSKIRKRKKARIAVEKQRNPTIGNKVIKKIGKKFLKKEAESLVAYSMELTTFFEKLIKVLMSKDLLPSVDWNSITLAQIAAYLIINEQQASTNNSTTSY
jgi:hypothetical protein